MKFLCTPLIILTCLIANAQYAIDWQSTVDKTSQPTAFNQDIEGDFIFTGVINYQETTYERNGDIYISKINSEGVFVWENQFGGNGYDEVQKISFDEDDDIVLSCFTESDEFGLNQVVVCEDTWEITLNNEGEVKKDSCVSKINGVTLHTNDEFIYQLSWKSSLTNPQTGYTGSFIHILKLNIQQDTVWQKIYWDLPHFKWRRALINQRNELVLFGDIFIEDRLSDYGIILLDKEGEIKSKINYGGSEREYLKFVIPTDDSGFIILGETLSEDNDISLNHGRWDIWLIKIDEFGNLKWEKSLGGDGEERIKSVAQTSPESLVICSNSSSRDLDPMVEHGFQSVWLVQINLEGEIIWSEMFGDENSESAKLMLQTNDGGFAILGTTHPQFNNFNFAHSWIWKLEASISHVQTEHKSPCTIFPNPSSDLLSIKSEDRIKLIEIYSSNGSLVITRTEPTINIENLPSGVYIIKIKTNKGWYSEQFCKI